MNLILFFEEFIKELKRQEEKIAYLQLLGKEEDYLLKEFCYVLFKKSNGEYFTITNKGNKKENKIDISVIKGEDLDNHDTLEIVEMIEAKYFSNKHEFRTHLRDADIGSPMKELNNQMRYIDKNTHGWLKLSPNVRKTNGLVFVSYVSPEISKESKENYYNKILEKARDSIKNINYKSLSLKSVFEDIIIAFANKNRYISLRVGLWFLN
jgi:hypothetical protein